MDQTEKPELIDRREAIRVLEKMIAARCTCTRSGTIEIQAFRQAILVLQKCRTHEK